MSRRTTAGIAALTVTATIALTACTGGAAVNEPAAGAADGTQTITYLIGQPDNPADLAKIKQSIATFEAKEQNVKVKLSTLPNDQIRTVLQTQLRSGKGPDIFGYDTGPGFAGVLASAGLLYDLTSAYEQNGWKIYDWAKQRVTFDGKVLGVPDQVEELGIYYNKDLFAKQGIAEPKSLPELEAAADKLKAAGVIPMTYSAKEGWQGGHILSMALASSIGSKRMRDLIDGKTPWTSPEVVAAIDTFFVRFNQKGYLPKTPTAITYDNANALFYSGKAAMNPTGTWLANDLRSTAKFQVGFIPFPAQNGAGIYAGGLGGGTFVSAKSQHPDAALKFLNYLLTPEHGQWQVKEMRSIPAFPVDTSAVDVEPLFKQILADTSKISSGTGDFGVNIDVLTSERFNQAMWSGLQAVLAGSKSPQQVAEALQQAAQR
jgi:raffinose/stachyose/melibiose transport system substrate-binding protein